MQAVFERLRDGAGHISFASGVPQAIAIVFLIFILLLVMARVTRTYISWYTSGWYVWVILGFLLAVCIEGFFVIGGSTVFTSLLGWKSAPKPIKSILETSRGKLIQELGARDAKPDSKSVITDFYQLDSSGSDEVKANICSKE